MKTIRELYRIGYGPSSSHTMGPSRAAAKYKERFPDAHRYIVTLYGSLAATGKGHLTDKALLDILGQDKLELIWKPNDTLPFHPNGMDFEARDSNNHSIDKWRVYSVGGGALKEENKVDND